jgi:hypothetical protein
VIAAQGPVLGQPFEKLAPLLQAGQVVDGQLIVDVRQGGVHTPGQWLVVP